MSVEIISPKKLIEVALPLDAINAACAYEKMPGIGAHPRGLHLWWARRPLAAARAVIFSQLVNDPEDLWRCQNPGIEPNKQVKGHWTKARARLFKIIEELVLWENTTNEEVLEKASEEIRKSWHEVCELNKEHPQAVELFNRDRMPGMHDPFAGGGAIPLEAKRLGLIAIASDLNPVAVLINKSMIELPSSFVGHPPVNPRSQSSYSLGTKEWNGLDGLSEDVAYYGNWIREEATKRIGERYPPICITSEMTDKRPDLQAYQGQNLNVIAWLWARTVKSPNPAFSSVEVPLVSSFILCSKKGREAFVVPIVRNGNYGFEVSVGVPHADSRAGTKASRGANFICLMSGTPIEPDYIKSEAIEGRMGAKLLAIVAEGKRGRLYLSPTPQHETAAMSISAQEAATAVHVPLANDPRNLWCLKYGLDHFDALFFPRQLMALKVLSDLVLDVKSAIQTDSANLSAHRASPIHEHLQTRQLSYDEVVSVYLSFAISRAADFNNSLCGWSSSNEKVMHLFGKQAIPMTWDFGEANILGDVVGGFGPAADYIAKCIKLLPATANGVAVQADAQSQRLSKNQFVSTDPPYYDNIAYADLSDFLYVWLRLSNRERFPNLFSTIAVPKHEELVAQPYRHGSKEKAERYFLDGMTQAMRMLAANSHPSAPITIYYAFKQSDTKKDITSSTGWETFLEATLKSGLMICGTWPLRSEQQFRQVGMGTNALASSILLVCKPRPEESETISRRSFIRELNSALPSALDAMTRESEGLPSPVAPVDLSQAIIGPGMAIFSKYSAVLEADGTPMTVRTALQLINRFLAEDDFDADTQFCLHWFDGHGWDHGVFGEADVLARAKATSVNGLVEAGVLRSGGGKVQLLRPADFSADWNPEKDHRIPIWEVLHQLIRALRKGGETEAGILLSQPSVQSRAEAARQLAYRLYTLCERKGWAEDARAYNELVTSWSAVESNASREPAHKQGELF